MPVRPILPLAPELLTADHVRAVLEACGYLSTAVLLSGTRQLPAGCRVAAQFGDLIATERGVTCLTVRCSVVINGAEQAVNGASCWQMRKMFRTFAGTDPLDLAIDADLLLGSPILLEDILALCEQVDDYLRQLVADLRSTVEELSVRDGEALDADAPTLRFEAKFVGGIATGRSGIVRSRSGSSSAAPPRISLRYRHITTAACDCLVDDVISELTRTMRGGGPDPASRHPAQQVISIEQSLVSSSHPVPVARVQPTGPGHRAAAIAVEPIQPSTSIH